MGGHFGSHGAKMVAQSAGRPQCFAGVLTIVELQTCVYGVCEIITLAASRLFVLEGKTCHVDGKQTCVELWENWIEFRIFIAALWTGLFHIWIL